MTRPRHGEVRDALRGKRKVTERKRGGENEGLGKTEGEKREGEDEEMEK